jgi:3'-phosphoadenosine 5'-phosphosulfate (PAPS) 3'-phosphatase
LQIFNKLITLLVYRTRNKQTEKHDSEAQQAEKSEMQLREKKKSEVVQKQAETLITEANDRLTRAATAQNITEIRAAQALLQSGSVQLAEAR